MQFNYGKQTIQFNNESLNVEEKSSTVSTSNNTQSAQKSSGNIQNQSQQVNSSNSQQFSNNASNTQQATGYPYNDSPQVSAVRNSNPIEYAAEESRVANGTSCIANEPLLGQAQSAYQDAHLTSN